MIADQANQVKKIKKMIINLRIYCLIKEYRFVISLLRDVFTCNIKIFNIMDKHLTETVFFSLQQTPF